MAQLKDILTFADVRNEGLDSDTDEHLLPKGHSRYRLNCRSGNTNGQSVGVVENVLGNEYVAYDFNVELGTTIKTIGTCEDIVNSRLYYFVYCSDSSHRILRYDIATNVVTTILQDAALNFMMNLPIYNPKFIDGYLVWTDGYNPPRQINIEKAINHTNGVPAGENSYGTITTQILDVIKYPPACEPTVEYGNDTTIDYNNLRGYLYQFSYRYIYDDNAKSVWSPYSKAALPQGDEFADGKFVEDQTLNNYIDLDILTGTDEVKRIEIAYRADNISNFQKVEIINRYESDGTMAIPSNSTYTYRFYNDKQGLVLDETDFIRPYDYVPQLAEDQEILDDERLVYANITEGYDNLTLDATVIPRNSPHVTTGGTDSNVVTITPPYYAIPPAYLLPITVNLTLPVSGIAKYSLTLTTVKELTVATDWETSQWQNTYPEEYTTETTIVYTSKNTDSLDDICNYFVTEFKKELTNLYSPNVDSGMIVNNGGGEIAFTNGLDTTTSFESWVTTDLTGFQVSVFSEKQKSFKQGAYHQFGIVYYDDANRSGFVNIDGIGDDLTTPTNLKGRVYVPYPTQVFPGTQSNSMQYYDMEWQIRHVPPVWATHYQWVYSSNQSVASFLQYFIKNTGSNIFRNAQDNIEIRLNAQIVTNNNYLVNSIISPYVWQKGDRARFVYNRADIDDTNHTYISDYVDVEILGQDSVSDNIILPDFNPEQYGMTREPSGNYGFLMEIYTPRKEPLESQIFYEIGECREIGNAGQYNRYHKGDIQNQDPSDPTGTPAHGIIASGDCYVKDRFGIDATTEETYTYPLEAENFSDYYESDDYDYGRLNIVNPDARRKQLTGYYRHGGKYVPLTKINNLYKFEAEDYDSVNIAYGSITAIRQIGYTLKILQEAKNTSQYISRTSLVDASGKTSLQKSDTVFGTKSVSNDDWGCKDAGSVVVNDRHMYFFDVNNGEYIRDSANGMIPISSYYMKNYWREIADGLKDSGANYYMYSMYDRKFDELNISIVIDTRSIIIPFNDFTIVYHETSNRWKSWRSYIPEYYGFVGNNTFSFVDGHLYRHNKGSLYNNFYGHNYNMELDVTSNMQPVVEKVFDSIAIHSNKIFYCPNKGDLSIVADTNYEGGMESRLKENKFTAIEGAFYGSVLNDMNDPLFTDETEALLEGRNMRGRAMKIKFTNTDTEHVELRFITVNSTISPHSG